MDCGEVVVTDGSANAGKACSCVGSCSRLEEQSDLHQGVAETDLYVFSSLCSSCVRAYTRHAIPRRSGDGCAASYRYRRPKHPLSTLAGPDGTLSGSLGDGMPTYKYAVKIVGGPRLATYQGCDRSHHFSYVLHSPFFVLCLQ